MRVMAKIALPVESGNQAVKDGSIGKLIRVPLSAGRRKRCISAASKGIGQRLSCSTCQTYPT